MENNILVEVHPQFERIAKERGFYSEPLIEKILEHGTIQHMDEIPADVRKIFVTAHDITPEDHVRMQASFQKHTDNAVSKTVNFPQSITIDDVKKEYELAYKLDCKGVTIYRDESRDQQVLSTVKKSKESDAGKTKDVRERATALQGWTYRLPTGCGPLFVTINELEMSFSNSPPTSL